MFYVELHDISKDYVRYFDTNVKYRCSTMYMDTCIRILYISSEYIRSIFFGGGTVLYT